MDDRSLKIYSFIQERYLWQFYSRTWDREENINNILKKIPGIILGEQLTLDGTTKDTCFYAEAKIAAIELKSKFPWLNELDKAQMEEIFKAVKEKLIDVTITRSQNCELNIPNY